MPIGRETAVPRYSFHTRARLPRPGILSPTPIILVDGTWLMLQEGIRKLFDLAYFLDCPDQLRLERRIARDLAERGGAPASIREEFWKTIIPTHGRLVSPQIKWVDYVLQEPVAESEINEIADRLRSMLSRREAEKLTAAERLASAARWVAGLPRAELYRADSVKTTATSA